MAFSELMFEFYKSLEPIKTKLIETLEERLFEVAFPDEEIKIKFPNARVYSEKEYLNSIGFLTTNAIISPLQAQKILKRMGFIDEIEQGVPDYEEFKRQKLNFGGSE
ncbi:MAG TPA: hypothetical protein EYP30_04350 [Archaeoglobaceae archaeon]|nr:hypothetical protein [Archaeoglobaceae archaeon]